MSPAPPLPTPQEIVKVCTNQAAVSIRFAFAAARIGETNGYRMARESPDELPFKVLRIGSRYKVSSASLLEGLGLSQPTEHDRPLAG